MGGAAGRDAGLGARRAHRRRPGRGRGRLHAPVHDAPARLPGLALERLARAPGRPGGADGPRG
ncbi:hypothetical protein ACFPRL_26515 [Pseudoclavibacter helvolus]